MTDEHRGITVLSINSTAHGTAKDTAAPDWRWPLITEWVMGMATRLIQGDVVVDDVVVDILLSSIMECAERVTMSSRHYNNSICPCELTSGVTHGARITHLDWATPGGLSLRHVELVTCAYLAEVVPVNS